MRVALRALSPHDIYPIYRELQDAETVKWLSSVPWPYQREDAVAFVTEFATPDDLVITADGDFAGVIRVAGEIGYWVAQDYRRRGVGRRAAQIAMLDHFASSDAPQQATHIEGNLPSRQLLLSIGFRETGQGEVTRRFDGATLPQRILQLSRADFAASLDIRTPRCRITPMTEADIPALHRIATQPDVAKMLMRFFPGQSLAELARLMRPAMNPLKRPARLAIRMDGRCIGSIGVDSGKTPSVFYFLAPEISGQGIASEVVPAFCDAVQDWHRLDILRAQVFSDNPASRRVLEKSGFVVTGSDLMLSAGRKAPGQGWIMQRG